MVKSLFKTLYLEHYMQLALERMRQYDLAGTYKIAEQLRQHAGDTPQWKNLMAILAYERGDDREAKRFFEEALEGMPDSATLNANYGCHLLKLGCWPKAWQFYEHRLEALGTPPWIAAGERWQGEAVDTLAVVPEQGYGDAIQFIRLAPYLKKFCRHLWFICPPDFVPILEGFAPGDTRGFDQVIITNSHELPPDVPYVSLLSIPYHIQMTLADIPRQTPYIFASPQSVRKWLPFFETLTPYTEGSRKLRVGLVWEGNPEYSSDAKRSMPAHYYKALKAVPGVAWISLQKNPRTQLPDVLHAEHLGPALTSFHETMGVLHHLDLVITVDTSIGHLAAAMGKPTWLLLPYANDWRWLSAQEFTPWYGTMRLFRQPSPGNWAALLYKLSHELRWVTTAPFPPLSQAITETSHPSDALLQEGHRLVTQGKEQEAKKHLERVLAYRPNHLGAYNILGVAQARTQRLQAAANSFRHAVSLKPSFKDGILNSSLALLKLNEWEKGWAAYETRLFVLSNQHAPAQGQLWHGEKIPGQRLFIIPEQGFGDNIQMARFIPDVLRASEASIHVIAKPELCRLLRASLPSNIQVIPWQAGCPQVARHDYYVSIMSLIHALKVHHIEAVARSGPYLEVPHECRQRWAGLVPKRDHRLAIGIVWQPGQETALPEKRACALQHWEGVFAIPGIDWVALYPRVPESVMGTPIITPALPIQDFADTAALIENLDLVISVDTAVAHLTGAMGRPVWALIDYNTADWRWPWPHQTTTPWYASMRVFPQQQAGDWQGVLRDVYQALQHRIV